MPTSSTPGQFKRALIGEKSRLIHILEEHILPAHGKDAWLRSLERSDRSGDRALGLRHGRWFSLHCDTRVGRITPLRAADRVARLHSDVDVVVGAQLEGVRSQSVHRHFTFVLGAVVADHGSEAAVIGRLNLEFVAGDL